MPILTNPRHELFAQAIAKGKGNLEAYKACGYETADEKQCIANASRLKAVESVGRRIEELLGQAAKRALITPERVMLEYAKIGFADIRNAVKWSNQLRSRNMEDAVETARASARGDAPVLGGDEAEILESAVLLVPSAELDDDTAAAISEVKQTKEGVAIKFHDKKGALDSLARTMGMFNDKHSLSFGGGDGGPLEITINYGKPEEKTP